MTQDEIFIECHKKAIGEDKAKKMLADAKKSLQGQEKPLNVYLNVYGNEVHVNGDVAASLSKGETLQERIARFDRLAAQVAAIRLARAMGMLPQEDDDEEDVNDFSKLDDVETRDDFGDIVEKHSAGSAAKAENDAVGDASDGVGSVSDDESDADASSSDDASMASES